MIMEILLMMMNKNGGYYLLFIYYHNMGVLNEKILKKRKIDFYFMGLLLISNQKQHVIFIFY